MVAVGETRGLRLHTAAPRMPRPRGARRSRSPCAAGVGTVARPRALRGDGRRYGSGPGRPDAGMVARARWSRPVASKATMPGRVRSPNPRAARYSRMSSNTVTLRTYRPSDPALRRVTPPPDDEIGRAHV